jgi:ABC-2 type transport system permease protein
MFRKVWDVAAKDLRQVSKDRGALVMLFVAPLLLVALLGSVLGNAFDAALKVKATLPIVNHDGGPQSAALVSALRHTPSLTVQVRTDEGALKKAVRDGDQVGLLIIPAGFSAEMRGYHPEARVTYYAVSNNTGTAAQVARDTVAAVIQRFAFQAEIADTMAQVRRRTGGVDPATAQQLAAQASNRLEEAPPVAVQTVNATARRINPADNTVPGYALMFALFGVMAGARVLLEERESGTLKRLLIAPLPPHALLGGKLLAQFALSLLQITVLFAAGALLFHINLGSSLPALILLIIGTSFAATGLGLILVSFIKSERQVRPVTMLVVMTFSAIGGSWWPISLEPAWMQSLAKVTLNGWAMEGFNGLMVFDKSFVQVLPDIAALFMYGLVCFAIARRTFRLTET